jgi:tetratricopeptide (TPR) repeat protein
MYEAAHKAYGRVLVDMEASKGPSHPFTARAINGLAAALVGLGSFDEALPLNERAVAIYSAAAQAAPPSTSPVEAGNDNAATTQPALDKQPLANLADAENNLGVTLYKLGRFPDAQKMYERALVNYKDVFGASHPMVNFTALVCSMLLPLCLPLFSLPPFFLGLRY